MMKTSARSLLSHASAAALSETRAHAIRSATGALLTAALPALSRPPVPEPEHPPKHQAEHQAFRTLVSAACYLSFNAQADPEAVLEAIQILHDLATGLREDASLNLSSPTSDEDRIWETARSRWERQKLVDIAVRFVKSPQATHHQKPKRRWAL